MDKECVRCYIKWYTEKEIRRSLIELTIELAVLDRILRKSMTDRVSRCFFRKGHRVEILRIPCGETRIASIGIFLEFLENPRYLIHRTTWSLGRPTSPELSVDLRKFSVHLCKLLIFEDFRDKFFFCHRRLSSLFYFIVIDIVRVIIPDMDIIFNEESDIGVSTEKPEKLGDDSFPVDFFRRKEWESFVEIETKLTSEKTIRDITTSEIFIIDSVFDELFSEVEILLFWVDRHRRK
jgi:hypothetical protein